MVAIDASSHSKRGSLPVLSLRALLAETSASSFRPVTIDVESDVAALPFSSGTTGVPKGVALTHANLTYNTQQKADSDYFNYRIPSSGEMPTAAP